MEIKKGIDDILKLVENSSILEDIKLLNQIKEKKIEDIQLQVDCDNFGEDKKLVCTLREITFIFEDGKHITLNGTPDVISAELNVF